MRSSREVSMEVDTASANSAAVAFKIYDPITQDEITLASDEYLVITDIALITSANMDVTIAANTNAAGKRIVCGTFAAGGGISHNMVTPHRCPRGVIPKLFAGADSQVDCVMHGWIQKA